jgi:hypothetical protein
MQGQEIENRTTRTGLPDRVAGTGPPERTVRRVQRKVRRVKPGQNGQNMTARSGQPGQDNLSRTAMIG